MQSKEQKRAYYWMHREEILRQLKLKRQSLTSEQRAKKREYHIKWRQTNPEKSRDYGRRYRAQTHVKVKDRAYTLMKKYGISVEYFDNLLTLQKNKCALCHRDLGQDIKIDHDHSDRSIRGLVHHSCNAILGFAHDNPDTLESAAAYLRIHNLKTKLSNFLNFNDKSSHSLPDSLRRD